LCPGGFEGPRVEREKLWRGEVQERIGRGFGATRIGVNGLVGGIKLQSG